MTVVELIDTAGLQSLTGSTTTPIVQSSEMVSVNSGGNSYRPSTNDRDFIRIVNTGTTMTVTAACHLACDMGCTTAHNFTIVIPATTGDLTFVVPYIDHYVDPDTGLVTLTYSGGTATIGLFRMPATV